MRILSILFSLLIGLALSQPVLAYKEADLQQLLKTNSCPSCELSKATLEGADLTKANLKWVNLSGADLTEASLQGADLTNVYLGQARLNQADLTGAKLEGVVGISKAIFCKTTMPDGTINDSGC